VKRDNMMSVNAQHRINAALHLFGLHLVFVTTNGVDYKAKIVRSYKA
jgi:hypothetical protein